MTNLLESWKAWAVGDAERRGLHALKPILEGLTASTTRLRATDWMAVQPASRPAASETSDPPNPARPAGPAT